MSIPSAARGLLRRGLDALPSQCALCRAWPGRPLCGACVARFAPAVPRCRGCALRVPAGVARCGGCLRHPGTLDTCLAACDYVWPWPDCIGHFKFQGEPGWAAPLCALMRAVPGADALLSQADRVLPMPLFPRRLRERGFNQAVEIARPLARAWGLPLRLDAVRRVRDGPPQASLEGAARRRNVRGAFAADARVVAGRSVLVVDDVMTTGATLDALARELKRAGAVRVENVVLARTP